MRLHMVAAGAAAILSVSTSTTASSQTAPASIEEIEVVGARNEPSNVTADAPITVIDADTIMAGSTTTLETLLTKQPSFGFQGVNASQNAGGYGAAFVDLHNLNFDRTLTLVDGSRFVLGGIRTDEAVDYNNIPLGLIDHVEVLRDGSEPEYGADAIAGVVNIVLKDHFEGSTISAYTGIAGAGDDFTRSIDATWGHVFDDGSLTLNIGDYHRDPIAQASRFWAALPITSASFLPNGKLALGYGSSAAPGGHAISSDGSIDALVLGPNDARPYDPATDFYNPANQSFLQGSADRKTANALARYRLFDDVTAFGQILYTARDAETRLPPQILGQQVTEKYPSGFIIPATDPYNFFGVPVSLQRVLSEAGPLDTLTGGSTWRFLAGFEGTLADALDWRFSYDHGESQTDYATRNAINLSHVFDTLGIGPDGCRADQGCVIADYFGPGSPSPQAVDYIRYTAISNSYYQEDVFSLNGRAPVATLPGGRMEVSGGLDYRNEHGGTSVDPVTAAGDQAAPDSTPTSGGYAVREGFLDLDLPLLADTNFAKVLAAGATLRYSDYDRFGAFPTWKAALSYAPDQDIRLRATTGTGRRVPAISEAFGGLAANFAAVTDPCDTVTGERSNPAVDANCNRQGLGTNFRQASPLIDIVSGGNADLVPEVSRNLTLGSVLTPHFLPGFSLAADYYRIKIANAIDSLADTDADFIPDTCYASLRLSSPLCPLIQRIASGPEAGQINRILGLDENIGSIETDGVELSFKYKFETGSFGTLSVDWDTDWLLHYRVHSIGENQAIDYAGHFASLIGVGSYTKFKSNLGITYAGGQDWSLGWTGRYIGGATMLGTNPATTPYASAPPLLYHDIVATYLMAPVTITLGIDNLTDKAPPTLIDGISNTDLNTYDLVGRFFYLRGSASF